MKQFFTLAKLTRFRNAMLTGLCLLVALAITTPANAVFITSNGDIYSQQDFPSTAGPPLLDITQLGFTTGRLFTNQVTGTPFANGSTIRTIGAVLLAEAIDGGTYSPLKNPDGTNILAIFGVEGRIDYSMAGLNAGEIGVRFTSGRVFLTSTIGGVTDVRDPDSWNFAGRFAEFSLLNAQDLIEGNTVGVYSAGDPSRPEDRVNISAVNTVDLVSAQGVLIFREDSTIFDVGNPGLGANTGDNWLSNVEEAPGYPGEWEGLAAYTSQTALNQSIAGGGGETAYDTNGAAAGGAFDAADLAALNLIGAFSDFGGVFATVGTGTQSDFDPHNPTSGAATGDFFANLNGHANVGYATPEPSSLLILTLGGGVFAFFASRQRRRELATAIAA